MPLTVDNTWIDNVPPRNSLYWGSVRDEARRIGSDGCTCVADIVVDACFEHDIHWRTGATIYNVAITTRQANRRFRKVIAARFQEHDHCLVRAVATPIGYAIAWGRWAGVSIGAHFISHKST